MAEQQFAFIGAGRMATALASGMVRAGLVTAAQICAADPLAASAEAFKRSTGGRLALSNQAAARDSDVLFLAVKPQQMPQVVEELRGVVGGKHLIISVAAGVTLATLAAGLGEAPRLVRVMPNTPCLIGAGASGYCLGRNASPADAQLVERLLNSVGKSVQVDEKLIDAVTGLSGSGPAFAFVILEALADGGVKVGLPRATAQLLAAQTLLGAARMVLETGEHPAALKDQVASPGGTTIAGLGALEQHGLRGALIAAVEAATLRSQQLGKSN